MIFLGHTQVVVLALEKGSELSLEPFDLQRGGWVHPFYFTGLFGVNSSPGVTDTDVPEWLSRLF